MNSWNSSPTITWAGRLLWLPRSWAIPIEPELREELTNSFCRTDPDIAKAFARVTFMSDNRTDLRQGQGPHADTSMQRGPHRPDAGRRVCPPADAGQQAGAHASDGPLPQSERARRNDFGDPCLCVRTARRQRVGLRQRISRISTRTRLAAICRSSPTAAYSRPTLRSRGGLGSLPSELVGKRLHELLNVAGRIFYETHFAPLLRMQGFFNEVALDLVTQQGRRLPVLVNAAERRDAEGRHLFTRLTVFNATDRRRYERELVEARAVAEEARKKAARAQRHLGSAHRIGHGRARPRAGGTPATCKS